MSYMAEDAFYAFEGLTTLRRTIDGCKGRLDAATGYGAAADDPATIAAAEHDLGVLRQAAARRARREG